MYRGVRRDSIDNALKITGSHTREELKQANQEHRNNHKEA